MQFFVFIGSHLNDVSSVSVTLFLVMVCVSILNVQNVKTDHLQNQTNQFLHGCAKKKIKSHIDLSHQ